MVALMSKTTFWLNQARQSAWNRQGRICAQRRGARRRRRFERIWDCDSATCLFAVYGFSVSPIRSVTAGRNYRGSRCDGAFECAPEFPTIMGIRTVPPLTNLDFRGCEKIG